MLNSNLKTINCQGRLLSLEDPLVMGILNITPDSFSDGGQFWHEKDALNHCEKMLNEGAEIIDIGAVSTKPFADDVSLEEEKKRLQNILPTLVKTFPHAIFSVDTFRSEIARMAVSEGASIINDISGGQADEHMFKTIGELQVPYVMMHTQGMPQTMQVEPKYDDVMNELIVFFAKQIASAHQAGVLDIIVDPGFGFGKNLEHNYEILGRLERFQILEKPIMVGFSKKSMIRNLLEVDIENSLNGTTVTNTVALLKGANILRVHDVKEAVEAVKIIKKCYSERSEESVSKQILRYAQDDNLKSKT
ncbi:MAG: dihydropteroate synthase [Bacteroidales bacterium]|nr:dihydropteroate synthase [Bacteroidales bacterium]